MVLKDSAQAPKKELLPSSRSQDLGEDDDALEDQVAKPLFPGSNQLKHIISGGVAGAVSRTCVSPLERVKILLQVSLKVQCQVTTFKLKFDGLFAGLFVLFVDSGQESKIFRSWCNFDQDRQRRRIKRLFQGILRFHLF